MGCRKINKEDFMKAETKWFGTIDIAEDKIITFDKGIIGFENCKKYTIK